jgi:predicted nuclease with RNAse H fold
VPECCGPGTGNPETMQWMRSQTGDANAVVAVDAPLVIPIQTGIRVAERQLNRQFRRYHAGCYPANLGRPFTPYALAFSKALEAQGFQHGVEMSPRQPGRFQIEVHPHAATVSLFELPRIIKYKRGRRCSARQGTDSPAPSPEVAVTSVATVIAPAATAAHSQGGIAETGRRSDRCRALCVHCCLLVVLGQKKKLGFRHPGRGLHRGASSGQRYWANDYRSFVMIMIKTPARLLVNRPQSECIVSRYESG